jgi:hypothetical protein
MKNEDGCMKMEGRSSEVMVVAGLGRDGGRGLRRFVSTYYEIWNMTWFAPESLPLQTFLIARCFFVLAILHATSDTTHT